MMTQPHLLRWPTRPGQRGFTMVELLVAMAVSMIVALAAISALIVSRQGFSAVDASSQLRDSARFAVDMIQRIGVQAGYKDIAYAATLRPTNNSGVASNPAPGVFGFDNALASATDPTGSSTARTAGSVGYGSDVLVLRYQIPETYPGSLVPDQSMIDCLGQSATAIPTDRDNTVASIIHVDIAEGEPSLMCTTVNATGTISTPRPIIKGVENFQILYGVDGVVANTAPTGTSDFVADRYLRADQMVVAGDAVATNANWRRVRSIRIGMVVRGAADSTNDRTSITYYPFGTAPGSSSGAAGSAMSSTSDAGTAFTPAFDGRLRQVVTFTVHLRNDQGL
ncbi:MAG: PilW family protein [Burkholderiaceae bacterium]|nr:PilW family protein [Burkholderiaceae bacterium]